ncbi:glycoside hydrolase family 3 N-terminal domain-containing protein [Fulvimonas sp. R45]|uniref:glycoside hydrolase family 3 protein n=1 Tax=Fulvimonas sp. R45 TaxID=3045937 RepID=UPI00265F27CE|nr:glycoside hydrolase family 3 N-terminal domain-containing protein [Fulvimonas sp. R45]MDO1530171.1 glycoside hydrolase family 3 N-terminal domain-containing protein [Fulvimonas sp. R45]
MNSRHWCGLVAMAVVAYAAGARATGPGLPPATHYADWPTIEGADAGDPALDARARRIVAGMTLAQKVGQMTQAGIKSVTPDDVRRYYLGSVLNGGGAWPGMDKHASIKAWLALADRYYDASMSTDMAIKVPVIWGTDAVHGDNNVYGATLFPHNVGLGAAHDPGLVREIGAATARAVRATGVSWAFAPTLAVAQDVRWGRSYESFSSQAPLVREYARAYVEGLQGDFGPHNVMATAKHFIGDGATWQGIDQGQARVDKATMVNVHGAGYYGALEAGVLSVMASFNSWDDVAGGVDYGKMSGSRALLTGALKDRMGFKGFVVSDWNAIGQLPGCSDASCPQAINAGIDMVMVPGDWKAFIANTIRQVRDGAIPMARIDDAVGRIVRAKLRMGLFGKRPSQLPGAGDARLLQDRALARRAVRESLVLLKNNRDVLPLKHGTKLLVVGKSADSLSNQAGGWSLTWQGTDNTNADFPNAQSILDGLRDADGAANVTFSENAQGIDPKDYDAIVAVVGETPSAEMMGDIAPSSTLRFGDRYPEDVALLEKVAKSGKPLVVVFVAGRPLFVNPVLDLSDAFVMAWLPGSEGGGVADVLFARGGHNFRGTLPRPWPGVPCPDAERAGPSRWLFAPGYGLRYPTRHDLPALPAHDDVKTCADASSMSVFHTLAVAPFALYLADAAHGEQAVGSDLNGETAWPGEHPLLRLRTVQVNTQQDAKAVAWLGAARFLARSAQPVDLSRLAAAHAALQFDVVVDTPAKGPVTLAMGCGSHCGGSVDLGPVLAGYAAGTRQSVSIPLACFARRGADLAHVDVPFEIRADAPFAASFADIRISAVAAANRRDLSCASVGVR